MSTRRAYQKKPASIMFTKNTYGAGVKVQYWEYRNEAEVKDNRVYECRLSNQVSTYQRLGSQDQGIPDTETRAMLKQVWDKVTPVYEFKPLVNFTSYPCTDTPSRNKLAKKANLAQLPADYGVMDYISTQQDDYRMPYPCPLKPITMKSPIWLQNRIINSNLTHNSGTAPPKGEYQCLDMHTPIDHIRRLKYTRYMSVDPATGCRTFPSPPT